MLERKAVRKEMWQMIKAEKRKSAKEFVFTTEEYAALPKYKDGREFSLNGDMYDVVSREIRNGKVILTAYFDHKETSLLKKFVSLFNEEQAPASQTQNGKHRNLFPEFVSAGTYNLLPPVVVVFPVSVTVSAVMQPVMEVCSPPPWLG